MDRIIQQYTFYSSLLVKLALLPSISIAFGRWSSSSSGTELNLALFVVMAMTLIYARSRGTGQLFRMQKRGPQQVLPLPPSGRHQNISESMENKSPNSA